MMTAAEVAALVAAIVADPDADRQAAAWRDFRDSSSSGSASSSSALAFGSAVLRTFPVSLRTLEQRTGLTAASLGLDGNSMGGDVSLDDVKYATLYVAAGSTVAAVASLALLPPNVGATFCYLFALIPVVFLGVGSTAPAVIADAIAAVKRGTGGGSAAGAGAVTTSERICRHEAAHFCCGYWCGLPVTQYSVEGGGVARVEFGVAATATSGGYSNTELAALAVTALAGLVGEAAQWEAAAGAAQDLRTLDGVLRRSQEFIGAAAQQDLTRWGALTAALLLKQNAAKYEAVVEAFQRQAGMDECIAILEG